jgi:hypothetical protein
VFRRRLCSIHEILQDGFAVARIRDNDVIVAYELRPLVIAPEPADRLESESQTSSTAADFKAAGGLERVVVVVHHLHADSSPTAMGESTLDDTIPTVLTFARRTSAAA